MTIAIHEAGNEHMIPGNDQMMPEELAADPASAAGGCSQPPACAAPEYRGAAIMDDGAEGRMRRDLADLEDDALLNITYSLPASSQRRIAAFEILVVRYRPLVRSCVRRYQNAPEPVEDLMQAGYVGLIKAISNFDPATGHSLGAYAQSCVSGEIKRHFRDKRWQIRVARPVKELAMQARTAAWQLTQELGGTPAESDLARYLGVSGHDLRDARLAEMALQPSSLDAPLSDVAGTSVLADILGGDDPRLEHMLGMQAVSTHWGELPPREQKILIMRFYGDMTQIQIGQQLGISQMQVSRLITKALGYLRPRVLGLDEPIAATTGPPGPSGRPQGSSADIYNVTR
jgi:RNA polymerase sigma-B factor